MRPDHRQPPKPQPSAWTIIGMALGLVFCVAGLLLVGMIVLLFIGLSHFASNK